jgi:hypothetical protein
VMDFAALSALTLEGEHPTSTAPAVKMTVIAATARVMRDFIIAAPLMLG